MRAYTICLWFLVFNLALALVNELQPFTIMSGGEAVSLFYNQEVVTQASALSNQTIGGLGDINFLSLFQTLGTAIFNATVGLPFMLSSLGVPAILIPILTVPAWYCYFAAIVQLATGRILPLFE